MKNFNKHSTRDTWQSRGIWTFDVGQGTNDF